MRVLHLYSDYRWTGPAEPVVNLVNRLKAKGVDARFACREAPQEKYRAGSIATRAAERDLEADLQFRLDRYNDPRNTLYDMHHLPRHLDEQEIDIVHTHLSHDHLMGVWAALRARRPVKVVRTNHKAVAMKTSLATRWLLRKTDAVFDYTQEAADANAPALQGASCLSRIIHPAIDLDRFHPDHVTQDVRTKLGYEPDHILVGIVARLQRHRRFDVLIEAFSKAVREQPKLRLLIIGRGKYAKTTVVEPIERFGVQDTVHMAGYITGSNYVDYLGALDVKVFLMPGSDGTCRAANEAMAMGLPVITSNRGILPSTIAHEERGLVIDDTPANLANAMVHLASAPDLRKQYGQNALHYAHSTFHLDDQADRVIDLYEELVPEPA